MPEARDLRDMTAEPRRIAILMMFESMSADRQKILRSCRIEHPVQDPVVDLVNQRLAMREPAGRSVG